jgi:hypothetical protein
LAAELESLLVKLEADNRQFNQAMNKADRSVGKFERNTSRNLRKAETRFERFGKNVRGQMGGLAAAIASGLSVAALDGMARATNSMADLAETVGFTTEQFQELRTMMVDNGMGFSEADRSLKRFSIAIGEVRANYGGFYTFLQRANPELLAQLQATNNQSDALRVMARAFQEIENPATRALLANNAFGKSGLQLGLILQQGEVAIDRAAKLAADYSTVIDEKAIESTRAWQREVDLLGQTLTATATNNGSVFLDWIRQGSEALRAWIASTEKVSATNRAFKQGVDNLSRTDMKKALEGAKEQLQALNEGFGNKAAIETYTRMVENLNDKLAATADRVGMFATAGLTPQAQENPLQVAPTMGAFKTVVDDSPHQYRQKMARERAEAMRVINDHAADMKAKAEAEIAEISSVIEGGISDPLRDAFDGNLQSMKTYFREFISDLGMAITRALVLKPLMEAISGGMSGAGGLVGLATSFLGRSGGGNVSPATPYMVGERGPELFVPHSAGRVMTNRESAGSGGATYNIDARHSDAGVAQRILQAMAQLEAKRPSAPEQQRAFSRRFPARARAA